MIKVIDKIMTKVVGLREKSHRYIIDDGSKDKKRYKKVSNKKKT